MWADETVFYQIYPLGFTGAPFVNDGIPVSRILKLKDWIPHIQKLGVGAVLLNPVFASVSHGYDTTDLRQPDCRLGSNEDMAAVCRAFHEAGIRVVLDGVFNHVGRGFGPFQDLLARRWESPYKDWFHVSFDGNNSYNDGLWYESWEGHEELVKLNLQNEDTVRYLLESVALWIREFDIDGLRLDVAYCLDRNFIGRLKEMGEHMKPEFFLVGEMIHGDYSGLLNSGLDSVTNYAVYKGLYSGFNSMNMFEIMHSLKRQEELYRGRHLLNFVDNHDVTRIASILNDPGHLPLVYTILFAMPGIPCIYYGSEWGTRGDKSQGDPALRPAFEAPAWEPLTDHIAALSKIFSASPALKYGAFRTLFLTNRQCVFERRVDGQRILAAVNADAAPFYAGFDSGAGQMKDLLTGKTVETGGGLQMEAYTSYLLCDL